jgi:hypothetical protein
MLDSLSCSFTFLSFKNVNEHERLSNITLRHKLKKQLVVRKDMDINEHERLSNITLRHKLKEQFVERKDMDIN